MSVSRARLEPLRDRLAERWADADLAALPLNDLLWRLGRLSDEIEARVERSRRPAGGDKLAGERSAA